MITGRQQVTVITMIYKII